MGWFDGNSKNEENELLNRNWSSRNASSITDRPMHAYGTVEIHECWDGKYRIEKDGFGTVVSATKL